MGGCPRRRSSFGLAGLDHHRQASPNLLTGGQRNVSRGAGANLAVGSPPINAPAPSLQGVTPKSCPTCAGKS
jgi:hypothetical protein